MSRTLNSILIVILYLLITSCGERQEVIAAKQAAAEAAVKKAEEDAVNKAEDAEVRAAVLRKLKDPDSAKFGRILKGEWQSDKESIKSKKYLITNEAQPVSQ